MTPQETFTQAVALHRSGDARGAEPLYRSVLQAQPGNIDALAMLGVLLRQTGRNQAALGMFTRAVAMKPDDPAIHGELGLTYFALGQFDSAAASLERLVGMTPSNAAAVTQLGRVYLAQGRQEAAARTLERALALKPGDPDIESSYAIALLNGGYVPRAIEGFRRVLARRPESPDAHQGLASGLRVTGQLEEALAHFREAARLRPGFWPAVSGEAHALEALGRFDESAAILENAIDSGAEEPTLAVAFARVCKRRHRLPDAKDLLERIVQRPKILRVHRSSLSSALGSVHEDLGDYDAAFENYARAKELMAGPFDERALEAWASSIIETFSKVRLAALPRSTVRSDLPVFIVGMPRSGTTLIEQIIASHPKGFGAGELRDIDEIAQSLPARLRTAARYPTAALSLTPPVVDAIASAHLARLRSLAGEGADRVTDKMPQNFVHLGLIALLFPGARVIHCTRSPLDTCFSIFVTRLSPLHTYANRLRDIAAYYKQYRRLMDHWRTVLEVPMLEAPYEKIVAEPEPRTRQLIDFLGLEWNDACLRSHESKRTVLTASVDQVRKPIYDSSINRWKRFEKHLGELKDALAEFL